MVVCALLTLDKNMIKTKFSAGFRISVSDIVVLIAGLGASIYFGFQMWQLSFVIGFAVAHFFLFCNVFRIQRRPELLWASTFVILAGGTFVYGVPGWLITILVSLVLTVVLIFLEMKKPCYHGIFWQSVNPKLEDWWKAKEARDC